MKTTIAALIDPAGRYYRSLGECALVLQWLMQTAAKYRQPGRYGACGPHEILCGYGGCVNCLDQAWHSFRKRTKTHREHVDNICDCILSAVCAQFTIDQQWRADEGIGLETWFVRRVRETGSTQTEVDAWDAFQRLDRFRLQESLNACWKDVKVLCFPQLFISRTVISLDVSISSTKELRQSKESASRWWVSDLLRQPAPKWSPYRENFAQFVTRATEYFRNAKPAYSKEGRGW